MLLFRFDAILVAAPRPADVASIISLYIRHAKGMFGMSLQLVRTHRRNVHETVFECRVYMTHVIIISERLTLSTCRTSSARPAEWMRVA